MRAGLGGRVAVAAVVLCASALIFLEPSSRGFDAQHGDWAIHVYLVDQLVRSLDAGRGIPTYLHGFGSGEAPYELYPVATHYFAAQIARLFDLRDDLESLVGWLGIAMYTLVALGVARLARRVSPWPIAALAGVIVLLDAGAAVPILYYALLAQTMALWAGVFAAIAAADVIRGGGAWAAVRTWAYVALAACAHPSGLLIAAAMIVACIVAARGQARTRSPFAALHVAIGVGASAIVWAPYGARLLDWGASYGNAGVEAAVALRNVVRGDLPEASFPILLALGYAGALAGLFSRRALPAFVAVVATALTLGYTDIPYLLSGLAPSEETARLAALRTIALAKPFVYVALAWLAGIGVEAVRARVRRPRSRRATLALALIGLGTIAVAARAVIPFASDRAWEVRGALRDEVHDEEGFEELLAWASERARESDGRFGRLYLDTADHYVQTIGTRTGLPVFHGYLLPMAFLRERMDETRPESLRRFGVRWIVKRGAPPPGGDPATQFRIGTYVIRLVPDWDGQFAHIERGAGRVRVTELDDDRITVRLDDTDAPALVSFPIGYYPRWRARHDGREIPVYGLRASATSERHVLAAWLPPGRTVLTADAPLPGDGRGRRASIVALLFAAVFLVVSVVPRLRHRALRTLARARRVVRVHRASIATSVLVAAAAVILGLAVREESEPVEAVRIFQGFGAGASIEAREKDDAPWEKCDRIAWAAYAECGRLGRVSGTMGGLIRHEAFSWPWSTPAIGITPRKAPSHFRIRMVRTLAGTYEAAASGDRARVRMRIEGHPEVSISAARQEIVLGDAPRERIIELEVDLQTERPASIVLVRTSAIERAQRVPEPPEAP